MYVCSMCAHEVYINIFMYNWSYTYTYMCEYRYMIIYSHTEMLS